MSEIERDDLFEGVVNEAAENPTVGMECRECGGKESPVRGAEENERTEEKPDYDFWEETRKETRKEYIKVRVKGFFRALVEVGGSPPWARPSRCRRTRCSGSCSRRRRHPLTTCGSASSIGRLTR